MQVLNINGYESYKITVNNGFSRLRFIYRELRGYFRTRKVKRILHVSQGAAGE